MEGRASLAIYCDAHAIQCGGIDITIHVDLAARKRTELCIDRDHLFHRFIDLSGISLSLGNDRR